MYNNKCSKEQKTTEGKYYNGKETWTKESKYKSSNFRIT